MTEIEHNKCEEINNESDSNSYTDCSNVIVAMELVSYIGFVLIILYKV